MSEKNSELEKANKFSESLIQDKQRLIALLEKQGCSYQAITDN